MAQRCVALNRIKSCSHNSDAMFTNHNYRLLNIYLAVSRVDYSLCLLLFDISFS